MGGNKKCFINLYFQITLQTCNLNTFVLENDFEYSPFLLTNLSTTSQLCPSLRLSYTFDVLNHIHQHNQPNTILYLLCVIYYALCAIYYVLYTMHYLLCTMYYALFTMHYALHTIYYSLYIIQYALCIRIYTYSYVFTILYLFICIHTYLLFHVEIRRNPVILVLTCSSRRVE